MSAFDEDIAADFILEAQEILDRLGEQLVSLEQAPQGLSPHTPARLPLSIMLP